LYAGEPASVFGEEVACFSFFWLLASAGAVPNEPMIRTPSKIQEIFFSGYSIDVLLAWSMRGPKELHEQSMRHAIKEEKC
jgi:hypothetical protein